jgi:hypothetical protein
MNAISKEMKELVGEHEAILAHMRSLTRAVENLSSQPAEAKERLWGYRQALYDFKDAMWFHLDVDDRVFKSILGEEAAEDPAAEHREIQQLVNDMVTMAECAVTDRMGREEMDRLCSSLGLAFKKICKLIELHMARENAILERVQKALNHK